MPRRAKDARLWLEPARKRADTGAQQAARWYILHKGRKISTGFAEPERAQAELSLEAYNGNRVVGTAAIPALLYFVTADVPDYPVKIGWCGGSLGTRLSNLQAANPFPLVVLGTAAGNAEDEAAIHRRFASSRLRGEWFARSVELLRFVAHKCGTAEWKAERNPGTDRDSTLPNVTEIGGFARKGR